jgi:hypothetical protein
MSAPVPPGFLSEPQIEKKLLKEATLAEFWRQHAPLLLFRSRPSAADPLYEIQLVWDLSDRIETYAWLWVDARQGNIVRRFPED